MLLVAAPPAWTTAATEPFVVESVSPTEPVRFAGVPDPDGTYDWGASVVCDRETFRAWWVRGMPHDRIVTAVGRAPSSWSAPRLVLAPRDAVVGDGLRDDAVEKMHVARPSVVRVDGTYYLFYEAPRRVGPVGDRGTWRESINQIFLATSPDGVTWTKHPRDEDPRPVIGLGPDAAVDRYGVGQPSALYVNGMFRLYYVESAFDLDDAPGPDRIRLAETRDPTQWGRAEDHPIVAYGAGVDVKWNAALDRFVMVYAAVNDLDRLPEERNYNLCVFTSADGIDWGPQPLWKRCGYDGSCNLVLRRPSPATRCFPTLVADAYGWIRSEEMRVIFSEGRLHDARADWKQYAGTWDFRTVCFTLRVEPARRAEDGQAAAE